MRQITRQSINAFMNGQKFNKGNMTVQRTQDDHGQDITLLQLHGNTIAYMTKDKSLFITSAGWQTMTTKERLNGLNGVSIHQKNFIWYLNGQQWDGNWTRVK